MNTKQLIWYSFAWSELRLLIAALALLLGGVPPVYYLIPDPLLGVAHMLLVLCWIASGAAAGILLYHWYEHGQRLFGRKDHTDTITFLILIVSGVNLGLAGVFGRNIGMTIFSGHLVFMITGIVYLYSAWHLWMKAKVHGKKLF